MNAQEGNMLLEAKQYEEAASAFMKETSYLKCGMKSLTNSNTHLTSGSIISSRLDIYC